MIGTKVLVTLGELRSINVYLLGEAYKPGTYTVSSLSSLTNILFASGGVSKIGSLRNIQIKRQGKVIGNYDFYNLLFSGDTSEDMRLQDGDSIFIPLIKSKVKINGAVLREGYFELKEGDLVSDLLSLAGLKSQLNTTIEYSSFETTEGKRVSNIYSISEVKNKEPKDSDALNLIANQARTINTIELSGEFKYPGVYSINKEDTLLDVILRAGGITDEGYTEGAIFTRETVIPKKCR